MGLRPKRTLLNPNFEGYRLSCKDTNSISRCSLTPSPFIARLSDNFFSFQLARVFSSFNHLTHDPYDQSDAVYFLDDSFNVVRCSVEDNGIEAAAVLNLPLPQCHADGLCFPPSIVVSSENSAIVSDGCGRIYLIALNRSSQSCTWLQTGVFHHDKACLLLDCVEEGGGWSCVIAEFEGIECNPEKSFTLQTFILQVDDGGHVGCVPAASLCGRSVPLYTALCPSDGSLCVLSDGCFTTTAASAAGSGSGKHSPPVSTLAVTPAKKKKKMCYDWQQSTEFVTVAFDLEADVRARDVAFSLTSKEVSLGLTDGTSFLRGKLAAAVDVEGSVWTIEKHRLELCLAKYQEGRQWPSLLLEEEEEAMDDNPFPLRNVETLSEEEKQLMLKRTEHLTSDKLVTDGDLGQQGSSLQQEFEECDKLPDRDHYLVRYGSTGHIQQQTNVSGNQWLFNTRLSSHSMPAFCLRSDVDACVWRPTPVAVATDQQRTGPFQCEHTATLNALGYVSASKQQKKFMVCPADASYGVISECTRNVFVYYPLEGGAGTTQNAALQTIFSLPPTGAGTADGADLPTSDETIIGIVALSSLRVVILTELTLYLLKV